MQDATEVVPGKVYFVSSNSQEVTKQLARDGLVINMDKELVYEPYSSDFGPLNLGCTYRFCEKLNSILAVCVP